MSTQQIKSIDTTRLEEAVRILENLAQRRKDNPKSRMDEPFYRLLANSFRAILTAKENGKYIVAHTMGFSAVEAILAMDMVPMSLEATSNQLGGLLHSQEEAFQAASAYGYHSDFCTVMNCVRGAVIQGWLPRPDAVVSSCGVCDAYVKIGDLLQAEYGCPNFNIDEPLYGSEEEYRYLQGELEDLVHFLEGVAGRKMDWDRFGEVMECSLRSRQTSKEIAELRKVVPCPVDNRLRGYLGVARTHAGSKEALSFLECARDEIRERVERGVGSIPEERHRLMFYGQPPAYSSNIVNWMANEQGVIIAAEVGTTYLGGIELDRAKPLESLAKKCSLGYRQRTLSFELSRAVECVKECQVDGALFWANVTCPMSTTRIKMVRDTLMEKTGIPTLVLDYDLIDPTYKPPEQIKESLEEFFEMLDDRKYDR